MDVITSEGAGGLPTLFLVVDYRVAVAATTEPVTIEYDDHSFEGRTGWREITARAGAGMRIVESNVPERDLSKGLSVYPADLTKAAPQVSFGSDSFRDARCGYDNADNDRAPSRQSRPRAASAAGDATR